MSGGFHPFHPGHLALYNSAKQAFPSADVVVGATNSQQKRPFNFKDKATLATIAGVDQGHFVEVNRQFAVKGEPNVEGRIQNPDDTLLILVRSEKDANDPVLQPWKPNPDGSVPMTKGSKNNPPRPTSNYLLSYKGNEKQLQPMTKHAYIAFLPVEEFGPANMTSATQIRDTWPTLNDRRKQAFAMSLYPATQKNSKLLATVVDIMNRNIGIVSEPVDSPLEKPVKGAINKLKANKLKANKLKEQIERIRPLIKEASPEKKLKLLKLMKEALNADEGIVKEITKQAAVQQYKDIQDYKHVNKKTTKPKPEDEKEFLRISISRPKKQPVMAEAFDQPYKTKSEKSDYGDVDMLARLPDGTNLSIMFNKQQNNEGEETIQVEFYRNNSQEVTGEGDAQRIFATVLTSIQKYIKKYKPARLSFSASKATDPTVYYEPDQPQPNPESRAKLYDRLVQRYAKAWGYRAFRADTGDLVIYELSRIKQEVDEVLGFLVNKPTSVTKPKTSLSSMRKEFEKDKTAKPEKVERSQDEPKDAKYVKYVRANEDNHIEESTDYLEEK
jgi:hypothetical protein